MKSIAAYVCQECDFQPYPFKFREWFPCTHVNGYSMTSMSSLDVPPSALSLSWIGFTRAVNRGMKVTGGCLCSLRNCISKPKNALVQVLTTLPPGVISWKVNFVSCKSTMKAKMEANTWRCRSQQYGSSAHVRSFLGGIFCTVDIHCRSL